MIPVKTITLVNALEKEMQQPVLDFVQKCMDQSILVQPYLGRRTIQYQNLLYTQTRSPSDIQKKAYALRVQGMPYLADQLQQTKPQDGLRVTNAVGGLSWHNWGLAVDFFVHNGDGKPQWKKSLYPEAGLIAKDLGFTWGGDFKKMPDFGHIQWPCKEVLEIHSPQHVNDFFEEEDRKKAPVDTK